METPPYSRHSVAIITGSADCFDGSDFHFPMPNSRSGSGSSDKCSSIPPTLLPSCPLAQPDSHPNLIVIHLYMTLGLGHLNTLLPAGYEEQVVVERIAVSWVWSGRGDWRCVDGPGRRGEG